MKTLAVTYTYHEHLASLDALEAVAHFEVEDDVAADMLAVEKPFGFTVMYVAEERAAEYAAAGHKQVARDPPAAPAAEKPKAARKTRAK